MRNLMNPKNPQPGYEYCWVFTGSSGYEVTESMMYGYECVKKTDPDAAGRPDAEGNCSWGDTVLMRIKTEDRDEVRAVKKDLDYRYSGKALEDEWAENVRRKDMTPFSFRNNQELSKIINQKEAK
jgi:hypothetical protein